MKCHPEKNPHEKTQWIGKVATAYEGGVRGEEQSLPFIWKKKCREGGREEEKKVPATVYGA